MPNWYLYYMVLRMRGHIPNIFRSQMLIPTNEVLVELRTRAAANWPDATTQQVQEFYEHLASGPETFAVHEARHLSRMEPWGLNEKEN